MFTVTNLTNSGQAAGNVYLEPGQSKSVEYVDAGIRAAVAANVMSVTPALSSGTAVGAITITEVNTAGSADTASVQAAVNTLIAAVNGLIASTSSVTAEVSVGSENP